MLRTITNNRGVALVSTLFFLIIVTMVATGSIILSTVQMKVASSITRWERGLSLAEGGISYVLPLLQYAHHDGTVPIQYCASMAADSPCVPPPAVNDLVSELQQTPDFSDGADVTIPVGGVSAFQNYSMAIDIDAIGTSLLAGGGVEASWAYHGSSRGSSRMKSFRVRSVATTPSGNVRTAICQVIWLRAVL